MGGLSGGAAQPSPQEAIARATVVRGGALSGSAPCAFTERAAQSRALRRAAHAVNSQVGHPPVRSVRGAHSSPRSRARARRSRGVAHSVEVVMSDERS